MDFKLENLDVAADSAGRLIPLTGDEEMLQRAFISIAAKRNGFIYNRELGSDIYTLDADDEMLSLKLELLMSEAIINCKGVEARVKEIDGESVTIELTCGDITEERMISLGQL